MFSIVIPTWNNLDYLKLCIESLQKYSKFDHEILVHVNDGSDGTLDWLVSKGIKYSQSKKNIGVCLATNHLVSQASHEWVMYMNDDMVACPGWDVGFSNAIDSVDTEVALFFATLIQAQTGNNPNMIQHDFGSGPGDFNESRFVQEFSNQVRGDIEGGTSQPTLFHKKWWQMVGGYSLEYSPGMSSDDDLLMKYWVLGCRNFRVVGASRFYHFGSISTDRIRHNMGGRIFVMKWGITQKEFFQNYLGTLPHSSNNQQVEQRAKSFPRATLLGRFRRASYGLLCDYPLEDIGRWDTRPGHHVSDESIR